MNKREARKIATYQAARALDTLVGSGWPFIMENDEDCEWSESDQDRILKELDHIIVQLFRGS